MLIIDLLGPVLQPEEKEILEHPQVVGVILFERNAVDRPQLAELIRTIKACCQTLIVLVDQEGGRVQRFKDGFTVIPPMGAFGTRYDRDPETALNQLRQLSVAVADELSSVQVDVNLAPVLDRHLGVSSVIGDRSFHKDPDKIIALARTYIQGFSAVGVRLVAKHFPGHGGIAADSHLSKACDERPYQHLWQEDMQPFIELSSLLPGIMPAHIVYPTQAQGNNPEPLPATFSRYWLKSVLRDRIGFKGVLVSDDLSMKGADIGGTVVDRVRCALGAGCDMVLLCNHRLGVINTLDAVDATQLSSHQLGQLDTLRRRAK